MINYLCGGIKSKYKTSLHKWNYNLSRQHCCVVVCAKAPHQKGQQFDTVLTHVVFVYRILILFLVCFFLEVGTDRGGQIRIFRFAVVYVWMVTYTHLSSDMCMYVSLLQYVLHVTVITNIEVKWTFECKHTLKVKCVCNPAQMAKRQQNSWGFVSLFLQLFNDVPVFALYTLTSSLYLTSAFLDIFPLELCFTHSPGKWKTDLTQSDRRLLKKKKKTPNELTNISVAWLWNVTKVFKNITWRGIERTQATELRVWQV